MILKDKSARQCLENLKEMSDLTSGTYRKGSEAVSLSGLDMLYKEFPRIMVETRNRQYVIYRTIRRSHYAITALTDFYALISLLPEGKLDLAVKMKKNVAFFWATFFTLITTFSVFLFIQNEFSGIVSFLFLCTSAAILLVEKMRFRQFVTELLNEF
ncbi:hypothetical protein ACTHGU_02860 [Chitinophagaceae bacterium MMS25-I14]